ncbi:diacylglycerol/lipid kinase family protein [Aureimonas mangrovi]|uniref:diacylglycerol/lipid kinase family protein n=1 Tax=Aureimonas mangrovi TaxID=2758041 RepID=UPI00163DAAED|nr:diacylglycerol kinase family protein [Aureimonas mangrovi]
MKIHAILNRSGGTLKTTDLDMLERLIRDEFALHGHTIEVEVVDGSGVGDAIGRAAKRDDLDVLLVGGGDGTVSGAAAALTGRPTALAILPAGTMNLFARSLQIPPDLNQAIPALADGRITAVDIAAVNGTPFVHQFAVGLHARMVRARESLDYGSRVGKMWATTRAVAATVNRLPLVSLRMEVDGRTETIESPAVAISNNLYGEWHLPYADDPQAGELGVYICRATKGWEVGKLALDVLRGAWRNNPSLTVLHARSVRIEHRHRKSHDRAVLDGELTDLAAISELEIRPCALKVLVPREATLRDV